MTGTFIGIGPARKLFQLQTVTADGQPVLMLPSMKLAPTWPGQQHDIQTLHRERRRLVNHRTALVGQMRGLLLDRGIPITLSIGRARRAIPDTLEKQTTG